MSNYQDININVLKAHMDSRYDNGDKDVDIFDKYVEFKVELSYKDETAIVDLIKNTSENEGEQLEFDKINKYSTNMESVIKFFDSFYKINIIEKVKDSVTLCHISYEIEDILNRCLGKILMNTLVINACYDYALNLEQ